MKSQRVLSAAFVLASMCLLVLAARRAGAQNAIEKRFDQRDRNKDGKVTPDEFPASDSFKRLDLDGNGEITKPEATRALMRGVLNEVGKPASDTPVPSGPTPAEAPVRQGPRPVRPGNHGVGRMVSDMSFTDLAGQSHKLSELAGQRVSVLAMTSTSCPLSKKYLPTLVDLVETSGPGIAWLLVNPVATDDPDDMRATAGQFNGQAIYVHDKEGQLAGGVGALTTTDVIVLDRSRTIVYHGAIDDQYGFGYSIDAARYRYLADALAWISARTG